MATDYYELLGVPKNTTDDALKKAYRKLAMQYHPDRNPGDKGAEDKFKEISNAYQVLADPEKRQVYDRYGADGLSGAGYGSGFGNVQDIFSSFGDIFGDIFGMGGGGAGQGRRGQRATQGADVDVRLGLTFREAVEGCRKVLEVARRVPCGSCEGSGAAPGTGVETCGTCQGRGQVVHSQGFFMISSTCPNCRGQGKTITTPCTQCRGGGVERSVDKVSVTIPAGVDTGQQLRLQAKGDVPPGRGVPGDLYVVIDVEEDERLKRDGADLHVEISLNYPLAVLGGTVSIPVLEGDKDISVKPGTKAGDVTVIRGGGMPRLHGHGRGDEYVHFHLEVPDNVSERARELLNELALEFGHEEPEGKRGIFDRFQRARKK